MISRHAVSTLCLVTSSFLGSQAVWGQIHKDPDARFIGITYLWTDDIKELAKANNVDLGVIPVGVYVSDVVNGSPASPHLKEGDVITQVNRVVVRSKDRFDEAMQEFKVGEEATVRIMRKQGRRWVKGTFLFTPTTWGEYASNCLVELKDEFSGKSEQWHRDSIRPYTGPTGIEVYLVGDDLLPAVRVRLTRDDWLFIGKVTFKVGDKTIELPVTRNNFHREVGNGGTIHEWTDVALPKELIAALGTASASDTIIVRLNGDTFYLDHEVSTDELLRAQTVLQARDLKLAQKKP